MSEKAPLVGILMGSDNDYEIMVEAAKVLKQFSIPFEMIVSSAHRTPERTAEYVSSAQGRGLKVLIAGAGAAAHLAGVVAAETCLPVIAVPIDATSLKGLDALLAMGSDACRHPCRDHGNRSCRRTQCWNLCGPDSFSSGRRAD